MLAFLRGYWIDLRASRALVAVVGTLATAVSIVLAIFNSENRAWWIAVALTAVVVLQAAAAWRAWRDSQPRSSSLQQRLDDLIREGMALLDEMSQPLEVQYPDHHYPLFAEAHTDRAVEFSARAREPLEREHPHLLPRFAAAANKEMRKERKKLNTASDESASNAERLRGFFETTHARPRIVVQGVLAGLADARERIGD